jgi:3-oxoadipate CoA-transferase alpha subunit
VAIEKRRATAEEAVAGIGDGATVMLSGFAGAGFANQLVRALRDLGPRDLTLVVNSATHRLSNTHELVAAGMVRKVICSAARGHDKSALSAFELLYKEGKIELEVLPQGTFVESIRAAGAGIPAYFTPTGFGTELAAGKETREFAGRGYVLEQAIAGDAALIRADTADRWGNLTFRHAQVNFGPAMATASKLVVAEVRAFSDTPIAPELVQLSGVYVDRIFVAGDRA